MLRDSQLTRALRRIAAERADSGGSGGSRPDPEARVARFHSAW